MEGFQYPSLRDAVSIRLLRLHPSVDRVTSIHIDLVDISLPSELASSQSQPSYEALSYVWGETADNVFVLCGGSKIMITPNCLAALKKLRLSTKERYLWVDAICIDQSSIPERNQQVARMGEIYMSASRVVIWLGDGDEDTNEFFRYLDADISHLQALRYASVLEN